MINLKRDTLAVLSGLLLIGSLLTGCSGPAVFLDRSFDFNYLENVAVIPFDNLSQSQVAGKQATLIFITELLASETFNVVEPGETAKALSEINAGRSTPLDLTQLNALGKKLNVQALILGTVNESTTYRSGGVTIPVVSMDVRLVETETGGTVWAAHHTEGRPGVLTTLFGLSTRSSAETMSDCAHKILATIIQ